MFARRSRFSEQVFYTSREKASWLFYYGTYAVRHTPSEHVRVMARNACPLSLYIKILMESQLKKTMPIHKVVCH